MQSEEFYSKPLSDAIADSAADGGEKRSVLIRPFGEKTEDKHPKERCFKAAEGEHIYEPDYARGVKGHQKYDDAKRCLHHACG